MRIIYDRSNQLYYGPYLYKSELLFFNERGVYILDSPENAGVYIWL